MRPMFAISQQTPHTVSSTIHSDPTSFCNLVFTEGPQGADPVLKQTQIRRSINVVES